MSVSLTPHLASIRSPLLTVDDFERTLARSLVPIAPYLEKTVWFTETTNEAPAVESANDATSEREQQQSPPPTSVDVPEEKLIDI